MSAVAELDVLPAPDPALAVASATTTGGSSASPAFALSDTFLLASRPGANHTIYLDFDGHVTSGTIWNSNYTGGANIVTPAYDSDGNPSSFSDAELQTIQYIWARVAEDFIPFDVNVTTVAPPSSDLIKSGTGDTRWGVRVAIGGSSYDWFGASAGGVAYVGSFNWNSDTPTYVFPAQLTNGTEKYTAEAISHEAGHTLGLSHDGTTSKDYYTGHGSGGTGWAPIMGAGYYQNLTQWSKGEYSDANQKQDDLAIISTQNGFGYRADDFGGTIGTAGALGTAATSVSGSGIIERTTDVDVLSFSTGTGPISLSVQPAERGPNLDILAELLDGAGSVISSSNPADQLSASISANLDAGTYYLRVSGVGKGDPLSTGYTDYASIGQYSISGSVVPVGAGFSINNVTINEGSGTAVFTVSLSQASSSTVTVDVATANGSATAGNDFQSVSFVSLTFDPGVTTQTISVPILDDAMGESTESFNVNLTNANGAVILDGQGVGTIIDNDVTVSISDASVTETNPAGNGATKTTDLVFTIRLSAAASSAVTVQYATANGSATAGSDYNSSAGTVTFNPGETSKSIVIKVIGDKLPEAMETVLVNLSNPSGAVLGDSQGVGSIIDNDSGGGGGGGGKASRGAAVGDPADQGISMKSLLASLADTLATRPGSASSPFQPSIPSPLVTFELFDSDSEEGGFKARELLNESRP